MFDVDGRVIAPGDLVDRVENLIREVEQVNPREKTRPEEPDTEDELPRVASQIPSMQAFHGKLSPPDPARAAGATGQATRFAKRLVKKLTGWYIEPRFAAQQHYDGHNIHFAFAVVDELHRIDRELDELRRQSLQVRMQILSSVERASRYRREVDRLFENLATKDEVRALRPRIRTSGNRRARVEPRSTTRSSKTAAVVRARTSAGPSRTTSACFPPRREAARSSTSDAAGARCSSS